MCRAPQHRSETPASCKVQCELTFLGSGMYVSGATAHVSDAWLGSEKKSFDSLSARLCANDCVCGVGGGGWGGAGIVVVSQRCKMLLLA